MKRWMSILVLAALLTVSLPALADDSVSLPDGRKFTLETTLVGEQIRGADCEWEEIYRLDVRVDGAAEPLQSLYFTARDSFEGQPAIKVHDLDFDGWPDLDILYLLGASNSQHTFFFWDANQGRFAPRNISAVWLSSFDLLPDQKLIVNYIHDSAATGTKEIYRWEEGRLRLVRRGDIAWSEDDEETLVLSIYEPDPAWGEIREVYRKELNLRTAQEGEELALDLEREALLWQGITE